jgi:hypothetical protein
MRTFFTPPEDPLNILFANMVIAKPVLGTIAISSEDA